MAAAVGVDHSGGNGTLPKGNRKEFLVIGNKGSRNINNGLQERKKKEDEPNQALRQAQKETKEKVMEVDSAVMSIVTRYIGCRAVLGDAADVVLQDALDRLDTLTQQIQDGSDENDMRILKKRKSVLLKKLQENAFKQKAEVIGVFLNYKMEFLVGLVPACFDRNGKLKTNCSYRWNFSSIKTIMEPCPPSHKKADTILHFGQLRVRNLGEQKIRSYSVYMEGDDFNSVLFILSSKRRPRKGSIDIQLVPPVDLPQNVMTTQAALTSITSSTSSNGRVTSSDTSGVDTSEYGPRTICTPGSGRRGFFRNIMGFWWKRVKRSDSYCTCTPAESLSSPSDHPVRPGKNGGKPTIMGDSSQSLAVSLY